MNRSKQTLLPHKSLTLVGSFVLLLVFVLAACGTNTSAGNPATGSPTTVVDTASCPNQTVVTTPPPPASVVLNTSNNNSTVSVNKGDTVEVDLSFGHHWEKATPSGGVSQNLLTEQTPSGYALSSSHMCVWRFVATGIGTAHLDFTGRPICQKGEACPMYIMMLSFTINIK